MRLYNFLVFLVYFFIFRGHYVLVVKAAIEVEIIASY